MRVGHTYAPIIIVDSSFDPSNVSFWVTARYTKDTNVFTYLQTVSIFLVMLCLMRLFFLSINPHLLHLFHHHLIFHYTLTNLWMLHIHHRFWLTMVQDVDLESSYLMMSLGLLLLHAQMRTSNAPGPWMSITRPLRTSIRCMGLMATMQPGPHRPASLAQLLLCRQPTRLGQLRRLRTCLHWLWMRLWTRLRPAFHLP